MLFHAPRVFCDPRKASSWRLTKGTMPRGITCRKRHVHNYQLFKTFDLRPDYVARFGRQCRTFIDCPHFRKCGRPYVTTLKIEKAFAVVTNANWIPSHYPSHAARAKILGSPFHHCNLLSFARPSSCARYRTAESYIPEETRRLDKHRAEMY